MSAKPLWFPLLVAPLLVAAQLQTPTTLPLPAGQETVCSLSRTDGALGFAKRRLGFQGSGVLASLSPRERAGVRGNAVLPAPNPDPNPAAPAPLTQAQSCPQSFQTLPPFHSLGHYAASITESSVFAFVALLSETGPAEAKVVSEHLSNDDASPGFRFARVRQPARKDAAAEAHFSIVDGDADTNGGSLDALHDGKLPAEDDQPAANFFFRAGSQGGRVLLDLGSAIDVKEVNTYSWHNAARGPQVYRLYAAEGAETGFAPQPKRGIDPLSCGWKSLASIDTRSPAGDLGGQYGVSVTAPAGALGRFRYLLFDISPTETRDPFGNTFFSEIDVIDLHAAPAAEESSLEPPQQILEVLEGPYRISIDTTDSPDLTEWAKNEVAPMARVWYPKIVKMLPSEGFEPPTRVSIVFSQSMNGVAATGGNKIRCAARWFRSNLQGEGKGAIFHELVHVVQQYGQARRSRPDAPRAPGWLVEGMADYLRWFQFEPQSHGAEITKRNFERARYDGSYRVTANFLDWVARKYAADIALQLNAAIREGRYGEEVWTKATGKTPAQLGQQWKDELAKDLSIPTPSAEPKPVNSDQK